MEVYWWQGGVHIHPESKEERKSLYVLTEALNITRTKKKASTGPITQSSDQESVIGVDELSEVVS